MNMNLGAIMPSGQTIGKLFWTFVFTATILFSGFCLANPAHGAFTGNAQGFTTTTGNGVFLMILFLLIFGGMIILLRNTWREHGLFGSAAGDRANRKK